MWSHALEFAQSRSHLGSKAEHLTRAGPISIVYPLGPCDWFRDGYTTQPMK